MVSPLFLRTMNVGLESIGLTSFFGLPWAVKFLWAPSIDTFGTRRSWMLLMQMCCAVIFIAEGLSTLLPGHWGMFIIAGLLLAGSFAASTHDTAIDGYYLAALDAKGQTKYLGYRVMAYRIAMMAGTGLIATIGTSAGWAEAFTAAGIMLLVLYFFHRFFLPRCETQKSPLIKAFHPLLKPRSVLSASVLGGAILSIFFLVKASWYTEATARLPFLRGVGFAEWVSILLLGALVAIGFLRRRIALFLLSKPDSFYSKAFLSFMESKNAGLIITCIVFLRTGEFLLSAMTAPFMVDVGIKVHYGWIQAAIGLPASIAGAMLGGWCISRLTLRRVLLPFLAAQNGSNLMYAALAFSLQRFVLINTAASVPVSIGPFNLAAAALVQGLDQFAGGLGTAVLMTFLMRICRGEFAAAHYAIGSGLMSISGIFTGAVSGFLASRLGYGGFFTITFLVSLPGMLLALAVMRVLPDEMK